IAARAALMVALPVFLSFITFFVERYVLLFSFAFVGSYCFMTGVDLLAHTGYLAGAKTLLDGNGYHRVVYEISRKVLAIIIMIPILWLISFGWQFVYNKNMKFGVVFEPKVIIEEEKVIESKPHEVVEHTKKETIIEH
ncbi:hypothetical protein CU098_010120, partial [Rhizopus stolonifer]